MPAHSIKQQGFMGLVHAIQKGEASSKDAGRDARKAARTMKPSDVKDFASTKHKGLPKKACMRMEDAARLLVAQILDEEGEEFMPGEERQEVSIARNILQSLQRLQSLISNPSPEEQHEITAIRAGANSLMRMHGLGTSRENAG